MATYYHPMGSVSSGTMRAEDLVPAFLDALDDCKRGLSLSTRAGEELGVTREVSRLDDLIAQIEDRSRADGYYEGEEADYDLEVLFDELDAFAAPYCQFDAHEGNGADYGFWLDWDHLDTSEHDGEILKLPAGELWPDNISDDVVYVLEVNDHGNATLYTRDHTEVWSVV